MVKINRINTYRPIYFKNAATKKTKKRPSKENTSAIMGLVDFETFRKTAMCNYVDQIGTNSARFKDEKYNLKNNLKVSIAKIPIYDDGVIEGKMLITPKKMEVDPLKLRILARMMNVAANNNFQDKNFVIIYSTETNIVAIFSSEKANTIQCFKNLTEFLKNPILKESTLKYAKDAEKEDLNDMKCGGQMAEDYLLNKNRSTTIEDVDKIGLDDIKKLYSELFANSQADIAICAATNFSDENSILNILSGIPLFMPFEEQYFTRPTKPLVENKTFNGEIVDRPCYSKYFILENDSKFKNELMGLILHDYYIKIMQRDFSDKSTQFDANYITDETTSIIRFDAWNKDYQGDLDEFKQNVNMGIEKLINEKMDESMLSKIKKDRKYRIIKDFTSGFTRMNKALSRYKDTDGSLKSQLEILDSITPQDVQAMAKRNLNNYYVEANN